MSDQDELLLLRALLRASDYGVLLSNADRRDLVCNRRFCELFGMAETQVLVSEPDVVRAQLLPRLKDPDGFVQALNVAYADPALTREDEVELVAPRPRVLRRYTAPVTDDSGHFIGRVWTFLDITRTRRLETKVRAQEAQLRIQARALAARLHKAESVLSVTQQQLFESEKLSAVGLLAASVAHDIRNILTPLQIEATLADQDDPAGRAESLAVIGRQVQRLSLLTHRLLALARPAQEERCPVDLGALARRLVEMLSPQAATENVTLTLRCPRWLPPVWADDVQVDQVLVNLALNALQAMQATCGGTLTLTLRAQGGGVRVRVADTGPGLSPTVRRRLFDPFFTTRRDGAGLGLFSCRRIVEAHGGTIRVRNNTGGGATFTLWLPQQGVGHGG